MKTFEKWLFAHDKLKHFFVGFFLFAICFYFFEGYIALCITATIALAKEIIWDGVMKKGTPEVRDWIYSLLPGLVIVLIENWK